MIVVGIDPGQSGGIASLIEQERDCVFLSAVPMGATEKDTSDHLWQLYVDSAAYGGIFAFIEKVHSMPKQGVASSFKFGMGYGFLRGCLVTIGIPFDDVTPQRWQKSMDCMTRGDKNVSKRRAQNLFPGLKITHALADALLLAEFGRRARLGVQAGALFQPSAIENRPPMETSPS